MTKKPDNPIVIVNGGGGCPYVTDPLNPHLGGNFDGGDEGTRYRHDLWPWLVANFHPRAMLDVGCGTGETARWFQENGVRSFGLDGLGFNAATCGSRNGIPCVVWDFRNGPLRIEGIDLIWCSDVAEHIDEEYLPAFFETLSYCKVLAMCQGLPENVDTGWHHVTNKPEEWWVDQLRAYGIIEDKALTEQSRKMGNHGWWNLTGRIYKPTP